MNTYALLKMSYYGLLILDILILVLLMKKTSENTSIRTI